MPQAPKSGYSNILFLEHCFAKMLFSEHFFVIFTLLHGRAYPSSENLNFVLFFLYENIAKNEENLVEENYEEHYHQNDEENDEK